MMIKYFLIAGLFLSVCGQNGMAQKIDAKGKGEAFTHYWSEGTCAGRANEGLRTSWVEQLKLVKEHCGFKYLRMHGLLTMICSSISKSRTDRRYITGSTSTKCTTVCWLSA